MILVRYDGVEHCPESPVVPAQPTLVLWWLSGDRSFALEMSIAGSSLMKLQSKIICMIGELRLSIPLLLWDIYSH